MKTISNTNRETLKAVFDCDDPMCLVSAFDTVDMAIQSIPDVIDGADPESWPWYGFHDADMTARVRRIEILNSAVVRADPHERADGTNHPGGILTLIHFRNG